jgi:hypothetical protein
VFRRLFWLCIGTGFGFGVSFWLMRWVRETAGRYAPERVSAELANVVRELSHDVREAVAEGRQAMREREEDLRAAIGRTR